MSIETLVTSLYRQQLSLSLTLDGVVASEAILLSALDTEYNIMFDGVQQSNQLALFHVPRCMASQICNIIPAHPARYFTTDYRAMLSEHNYSNLEMVTGRFKLH